MGTFADDLRHNRGSRFFLPYQEGWRSEYWSDHIARCGGEQALDDRDKEIADVGLAIGIRCQRVWEDIRIQEQVGPLPVMCAALIAQINYTFAEKKINEAIDTSVARSVNAQSSDAAVETINAELLTDIISDYIFSRMKMGSKLSTTLDLSSVLNDYSTNAYAHGLKDLLYSIALFRFVFDQLLFLDSVVTIESNRIICRVPSGGRSETYFALSKTSTLVESLILRSMESKRPESLPREYVDYSVVRSVHFTAGDFIADFIYIPLEADKSALILMRRSVEVEYLFQTLDNAAGGQDIYRAWDILHSLSKAMLANAVRMKKVNLFSTGINRVHLINIIARALGVSLTRARRVVDFFTFQGSSHDGIWSRPLVRVDRTFISLAHIAILEINRIRLLHHIVSNANLNDLRGRIFERKCIEQLGDASLQNIVKIVEFSNPIYRVLGIKRLETDFFLRLGDIILICEAKSTSHVATPREFYLGFEALKRGADQLKKRLQTLISYRSEVDKWLFGKTVTSLDLIPVIVTNTHFFEGLCIEGSQVVSLAALIRYFTHKVKMSCADDAYYRKEGLDMFLAATGSKEFKEHDLVKSSKGLAVLGLYGQLIEFDYFTVPGERVSVSSF